MKTLALILALMMFTGCVTTQKQAETLPAAETERQTQVRHAQPTTPRDGMWGKFATTDALRNPDGSVWLHADTNNPLPASSTAEMGWNFVNDSAGGLASADISFGTVAQGGPDYRMPAWEMLRSKVAGTDIKTTTDGDVIEAQGRAEALAKESAGNAASKILREHYQGQVALMKVGSEWLVTLKDGTFGILDRVSPTAAGVSLAKEAIVVYKNQATGQVSNTKVVAE